MARFFEQLAVCAATIDELFSSAFKPLYGQKADADLAGKRLAAWCRSSASGDWELFTKRLTRDGLSIERVMPHLATVCANSHLPEPQWLEDARWIEPALRQVPSEIFSAGIRLSENPKPFEDLFLNLISEAGNRRDVNLSPSALACLTNDTRMGFAYTLLSQISGLCAHAIYERFSIFRTESKAADTPSTYTTTEDSAYRYNQFITYMRKHGLRELWEAKPVLLRLISSLTRQWMETTGEFLTRLDADVDEFRKTLLGKTSNSPVVRVDADLSDLHNFGRSVFVVHFEDDTAVVYKPKDLRTDACWHDLVDRLNRRDPPVDLRATRVLACDGYGWTEFIQYQNCTDASEIEKFFHRAGSWLALFHVFAGTDMHEENIIAIGEHPVPIDLEMILQSRQFGEGSGEPAMCALETADRKLTESVIMTGLLPAFSRSHETKVIGVGGLHNRATHINAEDWCEINTDAMAPIRIQKSRPETSNLPRVNDQQVSLGDYRDHLITGFNSYARFLSENRHAILKEGYLKKFSGLPVRKVLKPTQFYALLLGRLRDHHNMGDGAEWSTHLDFIARLSDWDKITEPLWALFASERRALSDLNIPHFTCPTDSNQVRDAFGVCAKSRNQSGLSSARSRIESWDDGEVTWQSEVVRLSTITTANIDNEKLSDPIYSCSKLPEKISPLEKADIIKHASRIADQLAEYAIREEKSAAWIGLDWLGDTEACQLVPLGYDLYGGSSGIALFLAAHSRLARNFESGVLALEALSALRHILHSSGAARFARGMGLGGTTGMGSVVYALTVVSRLLDDAELFADAHHAASLFTDDLISADSSFDVMGGAAGGILGLLKLHRESQDPLVLARAVRCGKHMLDHRPQDEESLGLWHSTGNLPLSGFSHGAAGFAYALFSLSNVSGRKDFADAARDCIDYERSLFSTEQSGWPDLRPHGASVEPSWLCQWCHGAGGIGLARIGTHRFGGIEINELSFDIDAAATKAQRTWPSVDDTLCCGSLGNVELLRETATVLGRPDLRQLANQRLGGTIAAANQSGGFRWGGGEDPHNLGFFRGLSGMGYTLLRQIAPDILTNVLILE